jgi:hypothetical protein
MRRIAAGTCSAALLAASLSLAGLRPVGADEPTRPPPAPPPGAPAGGPAAPAAADGGFSALVEKYGPAIVTLKYVLKEGEAAGGDASGGESPQETTAALVEASGLAVVGGGAMAGGHPINLRLIFENETKEYDAVLVARDKLLNLAYVQVVDLEGRTPTAVDFSADAEVAIGRPLLGMTRSGRGFDYAPEVARLYASGRIEKPRKMWDVAGDFNEAGLPIFDASLRPVGLLSRQEGSEGAAEEDGGSEVAVCLLPLDAVRKSIAAAKKMVPDVVAKATKDKAEAPAPAAMEGEPAPMSEPVKPPAPPTPPPPAPAPPQPPAPIPRSGMSGS